MFNEQKKELEKIEQQLLCFETKNVYDKYNQSLCEIFANFILDLRSNSIDEALNKLDKIYQDNLEKNENKIDFRIYDISKIAVLVFEKLYKENKNNAFEKYIELIENKIHENEEWYYLDFSIWNENENNNIKNYFFEKAIEYIKKNQIDLQNFYNFFREKDFCKFDGDIPTSFNDLYDFFLWIKKSSFIDCFYNIHFYTNPNIEKLYNLIQTIINFYDYNTYYVNYKQENPIFKLFKLNNYFINGVLLSSKNIKLNIFLLKHFEYLIFGFINLLEETYEKSDEKYFKFLVNQLVEVFFKHFYNLTSKEQFHKVIFTALNVLIIKNNDFKFEVIDKIFEQLEIVEIYKEPYIKEFLFDYIFKNIVNLQLEINNVESCFLLSKYFKLANKLNIKVNDLQISVLCKIENLLNDDNLFLDFNFIEKIDFSLFYNPLYKNKLLNLIKFDEKKQSWQEIQAERNKNGTISSNDRQEPKHQIKLYFKILSDVFVNTYDKDIQDKIIELAKHFGLDIKFGIFCDFIFNRDFFYEKFLKILNLFDDEFFNTFLYELQIKNEIFKLIKLYNYTYSLKRKEKILNTIKKLENFDFDLWEKFSYNKQNIIEAVELLISNELFELADKVLDFIDSSNKEVDYLKCEKQILDLFFDNKENKDEKFNKLHQVKYPKDDRNRGIESLYNKCEEYKTLIRALMFFDDKPETTAIILENEISKATYYKKLYFVNLIESRIKIYLKKKTNRFRIKLLNTVKKYNNFLSSKKLKKDLFNYKSLLLAYIELNDFVNASLIIDEISNYYLRDFEMIVLKYNFLKKFKSELKAFEFLNHYRIFLTNEEIKKVEEAKLEDLFEYRKEIKKHLRKTLEYQFAISFAGEYRPYMQMLEKELRKLGYKVFLDCVYESEMLGEDLIDYLTNVFKYKAEYVVIFVSKEYKEKFYTNDVERPAIIDREYFQDCIILLQFDDTKLDEIPDSIFYLDLKDKKIEEIDWREIAQKLKEKYEK